MRHFASVAIAILVGLIGANSIEGQLPFLFEPETPLPYQILGPEYGPWLLPDTVTVTDRTVDYPVLYQAASKVSVSTGTRVTSTGVLVIESGSAIDLGPSLDIERGGSMDVRFK